VGILPEPPSRADGFYQDQTGPVGADAVSYQANAC
jgi:hypothetical protein